MRESGETLSELASCMAKFPQVLVNVRVKEKRPFHVIPGLTDHVSRFEADVKGAGRILLRYSGTESLARIMLEGEDQAHIERVAHEVAAVIRGEIGA
jgi:phosphoglucosamine mutase